MKIKNTINKQKLFIKKNKTKFKKHHRTSSERRRPMTSDDVIRLCLTTSSDVIGLPKTSDNVLRCLQTPLGQPE